MLNDFSTRVEIEIDKPVTYSGGATNMLCDNDGPLPWSVYLGEYSLEHSWKPPVVKCATINIDGSSRISIAVYGERSQPIFDYVMTQRKLDKEKRSANPLVELLILVLPLLSAEQVAALLNSAYNAGRDFGREEVRAGFRSLMGLYY